MSEYEMRQIRDRAMQLALEFSRDSYPHLSEDGLLALADKMTKFIIGETTKAVVKKKRKYTRHIKV